MCIVHVSSLYLHVRISFLSVFRHVVPSWKPGLSLFLVFVIGGWWLPSHRYTMRWISWRAPVHYVVDNLASIGTLCGG